jgi:hypothetical protein
VHMLHEFGGWGRAMAQRGGFGLFRWMVQLFDFMSHWFELCPQGRVVRSGRHFALVADHWFRLVQSLLSILARCSVARANALNPKKPRQNAGFSGRQLFFLESSCRHIPAW